MPREIAKVKQQIAIHKRDLQAVQAMQKEMDTDLFEGIDVAESAFALEFK